MLSLLILCYNWVTPDLSYCSLQHRSYPPWCLVRSQCSVTGCGIELPEPIMEKMKMGEKECGQGHRQTWHLTEWKNKEQSKKVLTKWISPPGQLYHQKGQTLPNLPSSTPALVLSGDDTVCRRLKTERGGKTRDPASLRLAQKHQGPVAGGCPSQLPVLRDWLALLHPGAQPGLLKIGRIK